MVGSSGMPWICALMVSGAVAAEVTVTGPHTVAVGEIELEVPPAPWVLVHDERFEKLPVLGEEKLAGWKQGPRLKGVITQETSARHMLDPDILVVKTADGTILGEGRDYRLEREWGCLSRLADGRLGPDDPVLVDYRHAQGRLDTVARQADGAIALRLGTPHLHLAAPPALEPGDVPLANIWQPRPLDALTADHIFPILETEYPEPPAEDPSVAERLLPKTIAKLRHGEPLKILAWGDSVTNGGFVGDPALRWQDQFVSRLTARWPNARIELVHLGWGGRSSQSFLDEPPGSPWNYQEKVVGSGADLIVMEFVNDAYLREPTLSARYGQHARDFQEAGSEWIILTPHYVRPDWMGLTGERDIDEDPRPYVTGLRAFAAAHDIPLADASRRWGRLWRQGIPYTTLLLNAINHPDGRGMKLFADALLALFPER